jgi:alpha-mannosidase
VRSALGIGEGAAEGNGHLAVLNPLWFSRASVLMARLPAGNRVSLDGRTLPTQMLPDGRTAIQLPPLAPLGWATLDVRVAGEPAQPPAPTEFSGSLENRFFRLRFDEFGALTSVYDKAAGREVLKRGMRGNVLQAFEDRPAACDAWNIDCTYPLKCREVRGETSVAAWEQGPVCASVRIRTAWGPTSITQVVRLFDSVARIDFETEIDWQESQTLLKALFPVDIRADQAVCGIQFGNVARPVTRNTAYDEARFEICFQRYLDLSEPDYGVSLLAGDKYGADVLDGHLRLTLLRSPMDPYPDGDRGLHRFTYSLYPHKGDWREARVPEMAALAEQPCALAESGAPPVKSASLLEISARNIAVESVKRAEDGRGLIVRMYEFEGARADALVRFDRAPSGAWSSDLLERDEQPLPPKGRSIRVGFSPYEIRTIRVEWPDLDRRPR